MSADMGSNTSLKQGKSASSLNTAASGNSAGAEGLMALFNEASEDQVGEVASKGAKGMVLRAVWKGSINVAIKEALNPNEDNTEETNLFVDLHHPHIVSCYGILEEAVPGQRTRTSIVTERCTISLDAFLKSHDRWMRFHDEPLTPDGIDFCKYTILEHVSQGLRKLHDMSVLHRDLKSLNILLDGEAGTCERCGHQGDWKLCDFGEAKILKTPVLAFGPKKEAPNVAAARFQPITSTQLREQGARHYCWLHPGETYQTAAGEEAGPYSSTRELTRLRQHLEALEWNALKTRATELGLSEEKVASLNYADDVITEVMRTLNPFPHGALVYSFAEVAGHHHPDDCVFAVEPRATADPDTVHQFPESLRPFSVIPADELNEILHKVAVDVKSGKYRIEQQQRSRSLWKPQVDRLHTLYPDGIEGRISTPHPVDVQSELDRRRRRIPERATHFVFAYQLKQWTTDSFTTEQLADFKMYSGEISLASCE